MKKIFAKLSSKSSSKPSSSVDSGKGSVQHRSDTSATSSSSTAPTTSAAAAPVITSAAPAHTVEHDAMGSASQDQQKISTADYIKAIGFRRTVYPLSDKVSVSDDRIVEIVQQVLAVAPSSYNTQPMRVAVLLGKHHKKLWQIVKEKGMPLLQGAGEEVVAAMSQRFDMFQAAYGSITFWEDQDAIKQSQETHKAAAHMFPQWGEHANGSLQIQVWTAVELEGLGANLQHMNAFPPVEAEIKKVFEIPESWSWRANLNIGAETAPHPSVPEKKPFSETVKVFKS